MKSLCIKTNNQKSIEYLLNKINELNLENIYYSYRQFKIYKNIIIHFSEKDEKKVIQKISKILASLVVEDFEIDIIQAIIFGEYFYFNQSERQQIAEITIEDLYDNEEALYPHAKAFEILENTFYEYLSFNRSIVLKGFITFRIKNYIEILVDQIDKSVNKLLIQREYNEFIALLKMYINTETSHTDIIHIIYSNSKSILLDKNKNVIDINSDIFGAKYLSDISFSSNDYALNTLLTLLPEKVYIHLIDNTIDEFITTLKLIFENRVIYCTDCNICNIYKKSHTV